MLREPGPLISPLAGGVGAAGAYKPLAPPGVVQLGMQPPLNGQVVSGQQGCCSCRSCCNICLWISGVSLVLLLILALRVNTASCTLDSFDCRLVLPANAKAAGVGEKFQVATSENTALAGLDLDLLGVWWMDGNPLTAEQLVSFAGARGTPPYPTDVQVPTGGPRRWSWSDSFIGRCLVFYYAMTEKADVEHTFAFKNNSYADITPVANVIPGVFGFKAINADEWDRVDTYILRRIVYPNGTASPFWDKFVDWYTSQYPSGRLIVESERGYSTCKRRCQYFSPCFLCDAVC